MSITLIIALAAVLVVAVTWFVLKDSGERPPDPSQVFQGSYELLQPAQPPAAPLALAQPHPLNGDGSYGTAAVGESHYRSAFEAVLGPRTEQGISIQTEAELVPEPSNPYDTNAVAVLLSRQKVAYLSRADARHFGPTVRDIVAGGSRAFCDAWIRGGWDRGDGDVGDFGIFLDLPRLPPPPPTSLEVLQNTLQRVRTCKNKESRKDAVTTALAAISEDALRSRLLLEYSQIETTFVLEKVRSLKSAAVKRKHLQAAIADLEHDEIPDELQASELQLLKAELAMILDSQGQKAQRHSPTEPRS